MSCGAHSQFATNKVEPDQSHYLTRMNSQPNDTSHISIDLIHTLFFRLSVQERKPISIEYARVPTH